jgi:hypothetical protein
VWRILEHADIAILLGDADAFDQRPLDRGDELGMAPVEPTGSGFYACRWHSRRPPDGEKMDRRGRARRTDFDDGTDRFS